MVDVKSLDPVLAATIAKQGVVAENPELLRDDAPGSRGRASKRTSEIVG